MLHYAQELFEGMKAYRGVDDKIRMFRPMHNMARMIASAQRACFPTFDGEQLVHCMRKYVLHTKEYTEVLIVCQFNLHFNMSVRCRNIETLRNIFFHFADLFK